MKAVVFEKFGEVPTIQTVPDPEPAPDGVVIKVEATGLCRSDWHGWMGHDDGITPAACAGPRACRRRGGRRQAR